MRHIFILIGLCAGSVACDRTQTAATSPELSYRGDTVIVAENSPVRKKIEVQTAHLEPFASEFKTVGTVRPVAGKYAEIAAPFAGRVMHSFVHLGQRVQAGTPIFELGSSEFYEAAKGYFAARSTNELAQKNYRRQQELAEHGVASQKELEAARNESVVAAQELDQAKATLKVFNIDESALSTGQGLKVTSPISGEVVKCDLTIGSYVKEDAEPMVAVADLSQVWVAALVKEKYFGAIHPGDKVEVFTDADPDQAIWGTLYYIGELLDEETRSLEVIVACDNAARALKLGMFCAVHFQSAPVESLILPSTAIMQQEAHDYVFVELEPGHYLRRAVRTETVDDKRVRILEGIDAGERIVTEGGIFIDE